MATYALRKFLGVVCIIVGLMGLVLPLTPGILLLLVGVELLGLSFLLPRRVRDPWEEAKKKLHEKYLFYRKKLPF